MYFALFVFFAVKILSQTTEMASMDTLDILFICAAFLFQSVLTVHFAMRKWRFETAIRFGWLVYALSIPAALFSIVQWTAGKPWYFWLAGFLFLAWAAFGYGVEYRYRLEWRSPIRWSIFVPYVLLYLATSMFYWWPLARLSRPLWFVFTVLYIVGMVLNITSHDGPRRTGSSTGI